MLRVSVSETRYVSPVGAAVSPVPVVDPGCRETRNVSPGCPVVPVGPVAEWDRVADCPRVADNPAVKSIWFGSFAPAVLGPAAGLLLLGACAGDERLTLHVNPEHF